MSFWLDKWLPFIFDSAEMLKRPRGIELLNPYPDEQVKKACLSFFNQYYNDNNKRTLILGINPGRLGAGITGIAFTDPEKLESHCGIINDFPKKEELSSKFIYQWILRNGTVEEFYQKFIILSVCPIGFISKGKNINYYDDATLTKRAEKLIVRQQNCIKSNADIGNKVYMLGKGKNYKYFKKLNEKHRWHEEVVALPHPRWVLQYRYKLRHVIMDDMTTIIQQ